MARKPTDSTSTATIGFEAKLWLTADKLRNNMAAAETSGASKTAAGSPQGERGAAHQCFLTRFASAEGKNGGVVTCEVQSASVEVEASRPFVIRNSAFGISLGPEHADTFRRNLHPDLRTDHVLANPHFNDSDTALRNSAFPQSEATAQVLSEAKNNMVALPGQLFYSKQIPVCLWFLAKNKNTDAKRGFRDRRQQTLFIDARKLGTLIERVHRELTDADLQKITATYHHWREPKTGGKRESISRRDLNLKAA